MFGKQSLMQSAVCAVCCAFIKFNPVTSSYQPTGAVRSAMPMQKYQKRDQQLYP